MLRKLLYRVFLVGVACVLVVVAAVGYVGYLAMQTPAYYTALLSVEPVDPEINQMLMRRYETDFKYWVQQSLSRQQAAVLERQESYDANQDIHTLSITQQQLNSHLASNAEGYGDIVDPRLRLSPVGIGFACRLVGGDYSCVLSAGLRPTVTENGDLRFDIRSLRAGELPLPLKTMTRCLPNDMVLGDRRMAIDLSGETPAVTLRGPYGTGRSARVKSIRCEEKEIVIEFLPPLLPSQTVESVAMVERAH